MPHLVKLPGLDSLEQVFGLVDGRHVAVEDFVPDLRDPDTIQVEIDVQGAIC